MVKIFADSRYKIEKNEIIKQVSSYLLEIGVTENYIINIIFIGKRKMKQIAAKYKKEETALPILSFPYLVDTNKDEPLLGEIFLCYPQVVLLAIEREKRVDDIIIELIKHGIDSILV